MTDTNTHAKIQEVCSNCDKDRHLLMFFHNGKTFLEKTVTRLMTKVDLLDKVNLCCSGICLERITSVSRLKNIYPCSFIIRAKSNTLCAHKFKKCLHTQKNKMVCIVNVHIVCTGIPNGMMKGDFHLT